MRASLKPSWPVRVSACLCLSLIVAPAAGSAQTVEPAVAFGTKHAVALRQNGDVLTWGENVMCQLGRRTSGNVDATPTPVVRHAKQIAAGDQHSLVLTAEGTVYGWGMNPHGALGTGATRDECEGPVAIASLAGRTVTQIATGANFSVVVTAEGDLYCSGDNAAGQCPAAPSGGSVSAFTRVPIAAIQGDVADVAAGAFHVLVLTRSGTVHAFGRGGDGQLGTGPSGAAGMVQGLSDVAAIAAGISHSVALMRDGTVRAWGRNQQSQLCSGDGAGRDVPSAVTSLPSAARVSSIAAGGHRTLLRTTDGTAFACGDNQSGAFGAAPRVIPTPVVIARSTHASVLATSGANTAFSANGCDVHLSGENGYRVAQPSGSTRVAAFAPRPGLSLCSGEPATASRGPVVHERVEGGRSGCWTPRVLEDAAAAPRSASLRETMVAIEEIVRRSAAWNDTPAAARMRTSLSIAVSGRSARMHVKAVPERKADGTRLWTGDCDVIRQIDRIGGALGQISIFVNPDPRGQFIRADGSGPALTGRVAGFPEYDGWVVITRDGRMPWVPVTLAEKLDAEAARRREALAEISRTPGVDDALVAMRRKQVADVEQYRASFSAAELRAPAVWGDPRGDGRTRLNADLTALRQTHGARASTLALDALAQYELRNLRPGDAAHAMAFKPDDAYLEAGGRIRLIAVRLPQAPGSDPARAAWQERVRATFDVASLASLLD